MASKAQVLNFTTGEITDLLEHAITQPMFSFIGASNAWPEREEEQYQLVFFQSAASFIAYRVDQGVKLNKAQNEWLSIATTLANEHKKSRKFIRLIDADLILREPAQLNELLKEHKVKFEENSLKDITTSVPVHEYIAARLRVLSFDELSGLDTLLRASSLPVTEIHEVIELGAALKRIKDQEAEQQAYVDELARQLEEQRQQHVSEKEQLAGQLAEKEELVACKEGENELLLLQIQQVQEELESTSVQAKTTQQKLNEISQDRDQLQEKHDNLKKRYEQQSEQVEELKKELKEKASSTNEIKEENELLLLQLQQVQEELEHYFLRVKELEKGSQSGDKLLSQRIEKLESEITRKNKKLHNFSQKMKTLREEKEKLAEKVEMLSSETRTVNLPAVIEKPKVQKHRIPTRFLNMVKLPFNGKPESIEKRTLKQQKQLLRDSDMFDEQYYLQENPDVASSTLEPVEHYLKFGGFEGRKPSKDFDSAFYLSEYPDVREGKINPLVHYLTFGVYEQRNPLDPK